MLAAQLVLTAGMLTAGTAAAAPQDVTPQLSRQDCGIGTLCLWEHENGQGQIRWLSPLRYGLNVPVGLDPIGFDDMADSLVSNYGIPENGDCVVLYQHWNGSAGFGNLLYVWAGAVVNDLRNEVGEHWHDEVSAFRFLKFPYCPNFPPDGVRFVPAGQTP